MITKNFNDKKIIIRKLSKKDLRNVKNFQDYINSLIEEEVMISFKKKKTLKEEKEWLKSKLKAIKKKKETILITEDGEKIIGISHIELRRDRQDHVGEFGISIRKEHRGFGFGKKLMAEILKLAKKELKPKPKIIRLSVFSTNKIAQNLYKKFGFKKVAQIPKQIQYKGKLIDEIIMLLYLR